jgi:hypothetical protein
MIASDTHSQRRRVERKGAGAGDGGVGRSGWVIEF